MPQLDPSLFATQLFWLFVTFMVLFLIAWKVALPRIADVLNARQNRIDSDLERAQTLKSEAEDVLSAYEKALAEATAEAQDIHRQNLQELAAERTRRQVEDAADQAAGMILNIMLLIGLQIEAARSMRLWLGSGLFRGRSERGDAAESVHGPITRSPTRNGRISWPLCAHGTSS